MNGRLFFYLLAVTALSIIAAVFTIRHNSEFSSAQGIGHAAFPSLNLDPDSATKLIVKTGSRTIGFRRTTDSSWVAEDKFEYPIAPRLIGRIISQLASMRRIEAKTRLSERFKLVGTESPDNPQTNSVLIRLENSKGRALVDTILGAQIKGRVDGTRDASFIREKNDQQVWLVTGSIDVPNSLVGWLDTRVINIDNQDIKKISFLSPEGSIYVVARPSATARFAYRGPSGVQFMDKNVADRLSNSLAKVSLVDVWPHKKRIIPKVHLKFIVVTFSGTKIVGRLWKYKNSDLISLRVDLEIEDKKWGSVTKKWKLNDRLSKWVYAIPNWQAERFLAPASWLEARIKGGLRQ